MLYTYNIKIFYKQKTRKVHHKTRIDKKKLMYESTFRVDKIKKLFKIAMQYLQINR